MSNSILSWTNDLGEELVIEALMRTLEQDKNTWSYVKGILKNWANKGISTISEAREEHVAFKKKLSQKWHTQQHQSAQEVVPEWFQELEQRRKKAPTNTMSDAVNEARIVKETRAILDEFNLQDS